MLAEKATVFEGWMVGDSPHQVSVTVIVFHPSPGGKSRTSKAGAAGSSVSSRIEIFASPASGPEVSFWTFGMKWPWRTMLATPSLPPSPSAVSDQFVIAVFGMKDAEARGARAGQRGTVRQRGFAHFQLHSEIRSALDRFQVLAMGCEDLQGERLRSLFNVRISPIGPKLAPRQVAAQMPRLALRRSRVKPPALRPCGRK